MLGWPLGGQGHVSWLPAERSWPQTLELNFLTTRKTKTISEHDGQLFLFVLWFYRLNTCINFSFFISSYNHVCGKCMHTIRETLPAFFFFFYRLGKPFINLVSLYPLITLLANQRVYNGQGPVHWLVHTMVYTTTTEQHDCTLCFYVS